MRKFVDLHLCVLLDDIRRIERLVNLSAELGYHVVGIPVPPNISQEKIQQITEICGRAGVEFVKRVDLMPKTSGELLNNLGVSGENLK